MIVSVLACPKACIGPTTESVLLLQGRVQQQHQYDSARRAAARRRTARTVSITTFSLFASL